ncbi:MAG: adenylyltransferase/cytidyltransferase family protein, partial [Clostridiales bacterium]|nr:adenylyltransferase/cytidyltransferase family protein [Clostridiales bacterium]
MKRAVFAGSFDPFTLGHKDIVLRASKLFDEVIVALAVSTGKNSRPITQREEIIAASLENVNNVHTMCFDGLLTDFMKK